MAWHEQAVLLDVSMPDIDGVAAAGEIGRSVPIVGILMLTMHDDAETVHDDAETVRAATRAGARGYILEGAGQDQIVRAIEAVASSDSIFGGEIARQVLDAAAGRAMPDAAAGRAMPDAAAGRAMPAADPFPDLSARERQIGVSAPTSTGCIKLGVSGRTEAALVAYPAVIQRLAGARAEPLTRSQRVNSGAFATATGWRPRYDSLARRVVGPAADRRPVTANPQPHLEP